MNTYYKIPAGKYKTIEYGFDAPTMQRHHDNQIIRGALVDDRLMQTHAQTGAVAVADTFYAASRGEFVTQEAAATEIIQAVARVAARWAAAVRPLAQV